MSWSKALAVAACLALAGCGFHPLYGDSSPSDALAQQLASVKVMQITEHYGQAMTNQLHDGLNPHALQVPVAYQLDVALREIKFDVAIRGDGTPSRRSLQLNAIWTLRRMKDNVVVAKGTPKSSVSHDVVNNEYANVVGDNTGELLAVRDLADQIQLDLANYLDQQSKT
jgi:LPS-assembly lipoprotein